MMIGSGNPSEGEMRPQMLDRFGLSVQVNTLQDVDQCTQLVLNRLAYEADPEAYLSEAMDDTTALRQKLLQAQELLESVTIPKTIQIKISDLCARMGIDGLRGDLITNRAAKAFAALAG